MNSPSTSSSLLAGVQSCDADAWTQFVRLYQPLIYSYARRRGLNGHDAADISQEVFCKLVKGIESFRRQGRVGGLRNWLRTIAHHEIVNLFRRRGDDRAVESVSQFAEQPMPESDDEAVDRQREDLELLRRALELAKPLFDERTWQVFWRTTVDGLSAEDAGTEVDMNAHAARQAKYRVNRRLRNLLDDWL